jgi:hypothetical protein
VGKSSLLEQFAASGDLCDRQHAKPVDGDGPQEQILDG